MSKAGESIIRGARQALAYIRGEQKEVAARKEDQEDSEQISHSLSPKGRQEKPSRNAK